ncbi:helicase [Mycobacterium sp. CBMA271]|uniref:septum site-determining protein Ssd n=1 Tax=unclassified Mycobacteroides TaxID=2618759 RepID=UPI00132519C6|nr:MULTISPECIES: septum site-determining protein Ssd [unclassified Mycobacteroides]MUM19615.1 helicase [Mycobacteroides sp. CBMA 326]MUM24216.1 helicase [Mycobacteroides sp. CBMA 271]
MSAHEGEPIVVAVGDRRLGDDIERIVAAIGRPLILATDAGSIGRQAWARAGAVILDGTDASLDAVTRLPRRMRVLLVCRDEPTSEVWRAAVTVGAEQVLALPADEERLVEACSAIPPSTGPGRAAVIAVVGGRGGAGASVLCAAIGLCAPGGALLVDADPYGGGIDLLLGWEDVEGLRWPDIDMRSGRVSFDALRRALPHRRGLVVVSGDRTGGGGNAEAIGGVIDSAREAGVPVVVDLPRRLGATSVVALDRANLVVVVTPAEVRACASAALVVAAVQATNPNVGVLVRGPAPSGLRPAEVAAIVGAPLIAAMRPEPNLGNRLDNDGLRLSRRSPLAIAAQSVLVLASHDGNGVAA